MPHSLAYGSFFLPISSCTKLFLDFCEVAIALQNHDSLTLSHKAFRGVVKTRCECMGSPVSPDPPLRCLAKARIADFEQKKLDFEQNNLKLEQKKLDFEQ